MPENLKQLFDFIDNDQFDNAKKYLNENPTLINAIHPKSRDHLIVLVLAAKNFPLIEFVLTRKELDFNYISEENQTFMDIILYHADPKVVILVTDKIQSLFNKGKLSVETVQDLIIDSNDSLVRLRARENTRGIARITERLGNLEQIKEILINAAIAKAEDSSLLRSALIEYCIKTDNADLFKRLDAKGLEPTSLIKVNGESTRPRDLLTERNVKLSSLFDATYQNSLAKLTSSHGVFAQKQVEQQRILDEVNKLEAEYHNKRAGLFASQIKGDMEKSGLTAAAIKAGPSRKQ